MVKKNNIILFSLLFLVMGILLSGCSKNSTENIKVESDEKKQEIEVSPSAPTQTNNQSTVSNSVDSELITEDNVEIGQLI